MTASQPLTITVDTSRHLTNHDPLIRELHATHGPDNVHVHHTSVTITLGHLSPASTEALDIMGHIVDACYRHQHTIDTLTARGNGPLFEPTTPEPEP